MNINDLLKKYNSVIVGYAKKLDWRDWEDHAQEIRIYILNNIYKYNPGKSELDYYVNLLAKTAYRKLIFDKVKQTQFEDSHIKLHIDFWGAYEHKDDKYEQLLEEIAKNLKKGQQTKVFWAIVYSTDDVKYRDIANSLNMEFGTFYYVLRKIRKIVQKVYKNHENLLIS